jgi:hypothetical protein
MTREMQFKITMRYCLTPVTRAIIKNQKITNADENAEEEELSHTVDRKVN